MENPRLIKLFKRRNLSDKFTAVFDFVRENWKPMLKYFTYFVLPFAIIQGLCIDVLMSQMSGSNMMSEAGIDTPSIIKYMCVGAIIYLVGYLFLSSFTFSMLKLYENRQERLQGITLKEVWASMRQNIWRLVLSTIMVVIVFVVMILILIIFSQISKLATFLFVFVIIAVSVAMVMITPVAVFEKFSVISLLPRSFRLGFKTWGGTLVFVGIISIIASILSGITSIPWYGVYLFENISSISPDEASIAVTVMSDIFGMLMTFGAYLTSVLIILGISFQYGHAVDVCDNVTVDEEIENFESEEKEEFE